ncbi:cyclodeaminase/cyclohydrolase family protein [Candidatus Bathyarchaeota archaeon]|nr:MAG: cyclodeaminase/cyclohydrolase family protein [Candidatus Bathyarchaeota archaeon]
MPLRTLDSAVQVMRLAEEVAQYGATNALSDVTTSKASAQASMEGAASNVLSNLDTLAAEQYVTKTRLRVSELRKEGQQLEQRIQEIVASRSR